VVHLKLNRSQAWRLLLLLSGGVCLVLAYLLMSGVAVSSAPRQQLRIAVPRQVSSASTLLAHQRGLFAREGLDVQIIEVDVGAEALRTVIDGDADLALANDTPFIFQVMDGRQLAIVASVSIASNVTALVGRSDHGIQKIGDLAGHRIGVTLGTSLQFQTDAALAEQRIPASSVQIVDTAPGDLIAALASGRVEAVAIWEPLLGTVLNAMAGQAVRLEESHVNDIRFNLVARRDFATRNVETVRRALAAIDAASRSLAADPAGGAAEVAARIGLARADAARIAGRTRFEVELDQALIMALDDQTRWAIRRRLVRGTIVPNYLEYIQFDALAALRPAAITTWR